MKQANNSVFCRISWCLLFLLIAWLPVCAQNSPSPAVLQQLRSKVAQERLAAVTQLGSEGDVRAVSALLGMLKDGNPMVRAGTATALGKLGDVRLHEVHLHRVECPEKHVEPATRDLIVDRTPGEMLPLEITPHRERDLAIIRARLELLAASDIGSEPNARACKAKHQCCDHRGSGEKRTVRVPRATRPPHAGRGASTTADPLCHA